MKKTTTVRNVSSKKAKLLKGRRQEIESILRTTEEQREQNKFSDEKIDREHLKITLRSGVVTSIAEFKQLVDKVIAEQVQPYEKTVQEPFYRHMARLTGVTLPTGPIPQKPSVFAWYTNQLIYMRFSKEILELLQRLNPVVVAELRQRRFKHFQLLKPDAKEKFVLYIQQAVDMMARHTSWYEFRKEYCTTYKLPFQLRTDDALV